MNQWTRREIVMAGLGAGGAALAPRAFAARTLRPADDHIKVGVIGCGGRGTGAAWNALEADPAVRVVALADLFQDRLDGSFRHLSEAEDWKGRIDVPPEHRFVGFDAYEKLVALPGVDYVILATPPHFRPIHFEAAVNAGKHVFMEKPAATDPAGVRRALAAARSAKERRLSVVAGTQRRHEASYLEAMGRIEGGAIGHVLGGNCYWNQGGLWVHDRRPEESDMEWQCRNWLYSCWLSGDHICEQHVHNLDVMNWAIGGTPIRCVGMGGRQVRTDAKYGNIFDHFAVEYEYEGGVSVTSMCRQIDGCDSRVDEVIRGTAGSMLTRPGHAEITGPRAWRYDGPRPNPYAVEHVDLIASIRGDGKYLNEGERVCHSTLTAIMGRMSAYTGKAVTWEQALNSSLDLSPPQYAFTSLEMGPVPTPGRTPLV